jgi:hypothetical protein
MPCNAPLHGWVGSNGAWTGNLQKGYKHRPMTIPCGQCIGCRQDKRREWALRMINEKITSKDSIFLTLTYSDEHLPNGSTLVKRDIQLFFKRLRQADNNDNIRHFSVGEYGDQTARPHYHCIIYNYFPSDTRKWDNTLYQSKSLEKIWGKGLALFGNVEYDSASYCAKYTTKNFLTDQETKAKLTAKYGSKYAKIQTQKEKYGDREPEFALMSRRPAIGFDFLQKYKEQIINNGYLTIEGNKISLPRYYKNKLNETEADNPIWQKTRAKIRDSVPDYDLELLTRLDDNRKISQKLKSIVDTASKI